MGAITFSQISKQEEIEKGDKTKENEAKITGLILLLNENLIKSDF